MEKRPGNEVEKEDWKQVVYYIYVENTFPLSFENGDMFLKKITSRAQIPLNAHAPIKNCVSFRSYDVSTIENGRFIQAKFFSGSWGDQKSKRLQTSTR